jgi:hypothetical protein
MPASSDTVVSKRHGGREAVLNKVYKKIQDKWLLIITIQGTFQQMAGKSPVTCIFFQSFSGRLRDSIGVNIWST